MGLRSRSVTRHADGDSAIGLTDLNAILDHTAMRRLLEPEEIADMIVTLVGPDARGMSGANVLIDAGFESLAGF